MKGDGALRLLTGRGRWVVLAAALLLAAIALPGLWRLGTDNSPHIFFVEGSPDVERYREFRERFGPDKVVRIAVSGEGLWSADGLGWLRILEEAAAEMPGVEVVSGLYSHHAGEPGQREWPPGDPEAFRRRVIGDPLDRALGWVGEGGEVATLLLVVSTTSNQAKARLLERLEGLVEEHPAPADTGLEARVVGIPVLDRTLDRSTREVVRRYFPLLVILAVVLLAAAFRRPGAVLLPLVFVGLVELVVLGLLGAAGVALNLILAILPPLLFVIALATAVHVLVRYRDFVEEGYDPPAATRAAFRDKGWAVLWTGVSTLVGFSSLALSRVAPVATLGRWAAVGIALMTVAALTVYPTLLPAIRVEAGGRHFERLFRHRGRCWALWAARRRSWVLGVAALTAAVALAALPRLNLETNALHYLPPDHPVRAEIERLETLGIGMTAVELVLVRGGEGEGFDNLAAFEALADLSERLGEEELVLGAVGAGDLLEDAVSRAPGGVLFGASTVRRMAFDRLSTGREGSPLARFLTADGGRARVTLLVRTVGYEELDPLRHRAEREARERFPGAEVITTGEFPLVLESQKELLSTLALSLTLTILAVGLIFRFLLPSTRLTLLAMVPNLWPVVGVVGLMGWVGVPLDVATVMVASVVLGLAVDDTIHTLGHFRELAPRHGRLEAVARTLERTAPSYVLTGLILGAGFGVCALSEFAPTSRFGLLSAAAIALAVLGDLFLLPALLGSTPETVIERMGDGGETG